MAAEPISRRLMSKSPAVSRKKKQALVNFRLEVTSVRTAHFTAGLLSLLQKETFALTREHRARSRGTFGLCSKGSSLVEQTENRFAKQRIDIRRAVDVRVATLKRDSEFREFSQNRRGLAAASAAGRRRVHYTSRRLARDMFHNLLAAGMRAPPAPPPPERTMDTDTNT
ncbi:hypothetical protein EVAR_7081_1 [Eumeta japonica]|uniref:Uncharacterized protein n=1 Tax=Eumeta variegata TaxID=151549 RepID=A0A4C1YC64_EUMVA|nr:hypothetical protein EVAR_7081_1 [Eumeta japonica]